MFNDTTERRCNACGNIYPLTAEYWNKSNKEIAGLAYTCRVCARQRATERYYAKRDEILAHAQIIRSTPEYKAQHKEYLKTYSQREYVKEHERQRGRLLRQQSAVKLKRRDWQRKYRSRLEVQEMNRCYRLKPQYIATKKAGTARRRARIQCAGGNVTSADIQLQYKAQKGKCWWCGKVVGKHYHADHLVPLARGGSNNPENIVISCPRCNLSKGDKLPSEWSDRLL